MHWLRRIHISLLLTMVIMAQYEAAASRIAKSRKVAPAKTSERSTNDAACRKVGSVNELSVVQHNVEMYAMHSHCASCVLLQVRFTTFNASLNRDRAGQLLQELQTNSSVQAAQGTSLKQP
jgi:hypothetical protein